MSTTNKLKGWVKNDAPEWMKRKGNVGLLFANATNAHLSFPATLVLHGSGEHNEVYTAEEHNGKLRKLLRALIDKSWVTLAATDPTFVDPEAFVKSEDIKAVFAKHGIIL